MASKHVKYTRLVFTRVLTVSRYKPGDTWGSVFGGMGPSYEECRAESVAMSLCPDYGILQIFGFGNGKEVHFP